MHIARSTVYTLHTPLIQRKDTLKKDKEINKSALLVHRLDKKNHTHIGAAVGLSDGKNKQIKRKVNRTKELYW